MKEAYITGASGFIGSHLAERLGQYEAIPHREIGNTRLEPFKYFYFLSAYGNMSFHGEDDKIIQANVGDLANVLFQAAKMDFKSFVYVSTSSVTLPRQTMYSRTKRAGEEIALAFKEKHGLPICIVRPYSVTGVGEQPEHLIPTLIRACHTGKKMDFVGYPTHDFVDVDDVVGGILMLSEKSAGGIFELGSGRKYSNRDVLEMVEKEVGKKIRINEVVQMRDYDTGHWVSQNERARKYGWWPEKTLKITIKEMVEDYRAKN